MKIKICFEIESSALFFIQTELDKLEKSIQNIEEHLGYIADCATNLPEPENMPTIFNDSLDEEN